MPESAKKIELRKSLFFSLKSFQSGTYSSFALSLVQYFIFHFEIVCNALHILVNNWMGNILGKNFQTRIVTKLKSVSATRLVYYIDGTGPASLRYRFHYVKFISTIDIPVFFLTFDDSKTKNLKSRKDSQSAIIDFDQVFQAFQCEYGLLFWSARPFSIFLVQLLWRGQK